MCQQIVQPSIGLAGPSQDRASLRFADVLRSLHRRVASWREHFGERSGTGNANDAMSGMNERMLKDIGAPGHMIAQAAVKREIERQYRENAFLGRIL